MPVTSSTAAVLTTGVYHDVAVHDNARGAMR
jgi:hypothetical protein